MSDAATQKGVAGMSDAEMVNSLAAMFDVEGLPDEQDQKRMQAEEAESTAEIGDDDASEETEADEDTEVEADDESDDEGEEPSDDEKWTPQSLDELAEALEMKPEDVASALKIKVKVDGEEGEATLRDVIKSYQLEKTLNKRLEAHATERKQFEAQTSETLKTLQERLQDAQLTASAMEQMLFSEYQAIDWQDLKSNDPTEYVLKQQEMRDRYASIQQAKAKIAESQQTQTAKTQEQMKAEVQQLVEQQKNLLLEKVPEWKDETRLKTDLTALQDYLKSSGATDQEIASIVDHRVYVMALKAMRYDQMQTKADPKMKQMKTKPKFVKPGARKDPAQVSDKRKKAALDRAKELQTDDAWAEALLAKLS
jgi:hypothetical protein